jgi:hypothetical protein
MKQIEVLFEELDDDRIKIIEIKNVARFNDLPNEYTKFRPTMGIFNYGEFMIFPSFEECWHLEHVALDGNHPYYCSKSKFNEIINTMKQCGENYAKAKKNAEEHKKHVIKSIKI